MPEKDTIFSSKIKYDGIFLFSDFYKFCHDWLKDETGLDISEDKYTEKLKGDSKELDTKIETNKGSVEIKTKGTLVRDYKGKFEGNFFQKFVRSIYEKWVITSRIREFEEKLIGDCDEFLAQAKAYLDLEGKH